MGELSAGSRRFAEGKWTVLGLLVVLLVSLSLRLYGINWDQGYMFHPDERAILMKVVGDLSLPWPPDFATLLDAKASPLNPHWFPYGSFPLYLLKFAGHVGSFFQQSLAGSPDLRFVGRFLSALFDTGTVLLVYLIGRQLYRPTVGLLAAAFVALSVLHIQLSHFYAVDVQLVFFIVLTIYVSLRLVQRPTTRNVLLLGLAFGLALATKVSAAPLVIPVVTAYALAVFSGDRGGRPLRSRAFPASKNLILTGLTAGVVFVLTQPYALLDFNAFMASVVEQSEMVRHIRDYPYTRQYVDTPKFLYHFLQLNQWGVGWPLGLSLWAGLALTLVAALRRRRSGELVLLSWVVPYFLINGSFEVKFLRYMLPLTPFLSIMAGRWLLDLRSWAIATQASERLISVAESLGRQPALAADVSVKRSPQSLGIAYQMAARPALSQVVSPRIFDLLILFVLGFTAFYALAFDNIYSGRHSAVRLSDWINANVPKGALILKEHWEEGLPNLGNHKQGTLNLYEDDNQQKLQHISSLLAQADYIVFFSNRLYATIPRLPERYPLTRHYYELLFSGKLGYELVAWSATYPNLLGISLVDDTFGRPGLPTPAPLVDYKPSPIAINGGFADESVTVYDHPKSMLFKKTQPFSQAELAERLTAGLANWPRTGAPKQGLLLSPADALADQMGGTWSALFDRGGLANQFPVIVWLVAAELAALAVLPMAVWVFRALPDRGFLLAKPLGLLWFAFVPWVAASLHLVPYDQKVILLALVLTLGLALWLAWRRRDEARALLAQQRRLWLVGETLFLGTFFAFLLLRAANPDLWHPWRGGEKPMDFAYLNAVVKTTYFPAYDPWFAGGYLNYYYFGQVIVATLIKATGVIPEVAYNLAVPLLFALTFVAAYSAGYNLIAAARNGASLKWPSFSPVSVAGGLAAGLFVAVIGNLDGMVQLVQGLWSLAGLEFNTAIPGVEGAIVTLAGLVSLVVGPKGLPTFDFWRSSRMMPPTPNITEFPFFTFLFADLHAHLIALPFAVLILGVVVALLVTKAPYVQQLDGIRHWAHRLALLTVLALVLGAIRIINSWDFPTYFVLGAAAILAIEWLERCRLDGWFLLVSAVQVLWVYLISLAAFWPFHTSYQFFYGGVSFNTEYSLLQQYLGVHGLFLFITGSYLALALWDGYRQTVPGRLARLALWHWPRWARLAGLYESQVKHGPDIRFVISCATGGVVLLVFITLVLSPLVAFLLAALSLTAAVLWREFTTWRSPPHLFGLLATGLALGLALGVELVTVQGDVGRMNTVFKFYLQAWLLWAIVSAFYLWAILARARGPLIRLGRSLTSLLRRGQFVPVRFGVGQALWGVALLLLLAGVSIYPLFATPVRLRDRFQPLPLTLDGAAYMQKAVYDEEKGKVDLAQDYAALRWMQDTVQGSPVILEAVTPLYRWGSRVSVYTGLPTVIGWDWHQKQQRWGYQQMVDQRLGEVREAFSSPDPAKLMDVVHKYNVKYIYVGKLERLYYPPQGLAKIDALVGKGLELAYSNPDVKIYRVVETRA